MEPGIFEIELDRLAAAGIPRVDAPVCVAYVLLSGASFDERPVAALPERDARAVVGLLRLLARHAVLLLPPYLWGDLQILAAPHRPGWTRVAVALPGTDEPTGGAPARDRRPR